MANNNLDDQTNEVIVPIPKPETRIALDDIDLLAKVIYGEARGEGEEGMKAVGSVVLNRYISGRYGDTIEEVIKKPKQFSVFNPETAPEEYKADENYLSTISATKDDVLYATALDIAEGLLQGKYRDNTDGATHYFNPDEANPDWINSPEMFSIKKIGNHSFWYSQWDDIKDWR